jgi:hypothetical protein
METCFHLNRMAERRYESTLSSGVPSLLAESIADPTARTLPDNGRMFTTHYSQYPPVRIFKVHVYFWKVSMLLFPVLGYGIGVQQLCTSYGLPLALTAAQIPRNLSLGHNCYTASRQKFPGPSVGFLIGSEIAALTTRKERI